MALRILLVDDSKVTRMMITRTLAMAGLPVASLVEADNGQAALERMRAAPVDLVLADINMPVMGGVELITAMRADPHLAAIPVVVISTEGSTTRRAELHALGVRAYLRKPFTPESVRDTLRKVLGGGDDEAESQSA
jgi:two-component system chemotaxis response regulator CheY